MFDHNYKNVTAAGTAVRLASNVAVRDGYSVHVKAKIGNVGTVRIGKTKATAEDSNIGFPLAPGGIVDVNVENLNQIWEDADNNDDGVNWLVEVNKRQ